jgi:hypothetical protein
MDFSTSTFESATPADGVGLGGDKAGVASTSHPPMAADTGGTLPAISEVEMTEHGTPPAEAWPCRLTAFHGASTGASDRTLLQNDRYQRYRVLAQIVDNKRTPLTSMSWDGGISVLARWSLTLLQ